MMRLTRRGSLLVAFCLLTSAATAYAECAWVMWEERPLKSGEYWEFYKKNYRPLES